MTLSRDVSLRYNANSVERLSACVSHNIHAAADPGRSAMAHRGPGSVRNAASIQPKHRESVLRDGHGKRRLGGRTPLDGARWKLLQNAIGQHIGEHEHVHVSRVEGGNVGRPIHGKPRNSFAGGEGEGFRGG